jgi:16S rRNA (guanine527-N7)-methyltransferase
MGGQALASTVIADAAAAGVYLSDEQWRLIARYRDLVLEWNEQFNLTAIREPAGVEQRLMLDAMRMVPVLDGWLARMNVTRPVRLVDVGSGAGFPGLVLKIVRPDLRIVLVEATGKKVRFLEHVIATLRLDHAEAIHARAEDVGHDQGYRERFDIATARAVASLPALLELCGPLLQTGGVAFFPKSLDLDQELAAGHRAAPLVGMVIEESTILPHSSTRLVTAVKMGYTPARFPRRPGLPAKEPLGGTDPAR